MIKVTSKSKFKIFTWLIFVNNESRFYFEVPSETSDKIGTMTRTNLEIIQILFAKKKKRFYFEGVLSKNN